MHTLRGHTKYVCSPPLFRYFSSPLSCVSSFIVFFVFVCHLLISTFFWWVFSLCRCIVYNLMTRRLWAALEVRARSFFVRLPIVNWTRRYDISFVLPFLCFFNKLILSFFLMDYVSVCLVLLFAFFSLVNWCLLSHIRADRTVKIWDLATGVCTNTIQTGGVGVQCVGDAIVTGSMERTIKVIGACFWQTTLTKSTIKYASENFSKSFLPLDVGLAHQHLHQDYRSRTREWHLVFG